ncbi:hypothetical protein ACIQV2_32065 [Streptomyces globosus]|uniref:hypothetical protein n=1 Tax=Streptomyces globosus TaxID=68209 RepID=UPI00382673E4
MDPLRLARAALHVLTETDAGDTAAQTAQTAQTALPARIRLLAETRLRATASGTVALHRLRDAPGAASTTMAEIVLADEADRDPAFAAALGALLEELREAPGAARSARPAPGAGPASGAADAAARGAGAGAAAAAAGSAPASAAAQGPPGVPGPAQSAGWAANAPAQAAPESLLPSPPAQAQGPAKAQAPRPPGSGGDGPERAGPERAGPERAGQGAAGSRAIPGGAGRPAPAGRSAGRAVRGAFLAGAAATTAIAATGGRVPGFLWPLLLLLAVAGMVCARSAVRRPFRPLPAAGLLLNLAVLALLLADAVTGRAF